MTQGTQSFYIKKRYQRLPPPIAHKIKGPLININLAADMLKLSITDAALHQYLDVIARSAARINTTVNTPVALSPLVSKKPEKYSLHVLLNEVLETLSNEIKLKDITVVKQYNAGDCILVVNKAALKIALTNVINNAVEAMALQNGVLTITTKPVDGKYLLHIHDNGCGISKVNRGYLFRNCFSTKTGQLGLGLPSIYHFLRQHHISTNIETEEGEGTLFSLAFNR